MKLIIEYNYEKYELKVLFFMLKKNRASIIFNLKSIIT